MYKCTHFNIKELVPPETYNKYYDFSWHFLDNRILMVADYLREAYGSAIVNDWQWGGRFKYSGLRPPECTEGSKYSQHRFGRALDMKFKNISAAEVRQDLFKTWSKELCKKEFGFPITITVEGDVSWLHIDVRNNNDLFNIFEVK